MGANQSFKTIKVQVISFTLPNGDSYKGEVDPQNKNIPQGQGFLITKDNDVYEGKFVRGQLEGEGSCLRNNKDKYIGTFSRG